MKEHQEWTLTRYAWGGNGNMTIVINGHEKVTILKPARITKKIKKKAVGKK